MTLNSSDVSRMRSPVMTRLLQHALCGLCLALCLWLFVDNVLQASFVPTRLLPLFASFVIAALSLLLLGLRPAQCPACVMAAYLMALAVLARDNVAGLSTLAPFALDTARSGAVHFRPVHLVWVTVLGTAPLLFALLTVNGPARRSFHMRRMVMAAGLVLMLAAGQALLIILGSRGALQGLELTPLALRLHFPQHQLLLYAAPFLMLQQLIALWMLWRHYQEEPESRRAALISVFGVAALFTALCIINNALPAPMTGLLANLCAYLVPIVFVWATERYALFDIKITVRRVVRYALARQILTAMTLGPLLVLTFLLGFYFNPERIGRSATNGNFIPAWRDALQQQGVIPCLILFGVFAVMLALRLPLLRWLDRAYFREVYNAQEILDRVGRSLVGLSDPREIARRALEGIDATLHPVCALLLVTDGEQMQCLGQRGIIPCISSLRDLSLLNFDQVTEIGPAGRARSVPSDPPGGLPARIHALLQEARIRVILPLREEERTSGVLLLGEKASGVEYTPDDFEILQALASHIALALLSARLNQELVRQGTQELTARSAEFIAQVERERRLLAADLHDQTLPELRALLADLYTLEEQQTVSGPDRTDCLAGPTPRVMAEHLRAAIENIRDMMESLRPSALEMLGLLPALESELRKSAARARPPVVPQFQATLEAGMCTLDAFAEVSVFRIMQESVNNACRHAGAQTVRVEVRIDGSDWVLTVEDDGHGLPPEGERHQGHGLENIRYRAGLIHAQVLWSTPESGRGTRMELRVPLRRSNLSVSGSQ